MCACLYVHVSGDKWDEVSASHYLSRVLKHTVPTFATDINVSVQPHPTLHAPTDIHLISSGVSFLDTPFGIAVRSPAHNDSVVYLRKGECQIEKTQKPVENIWKFDTKHSDIQHWGAVLDTGAQRGATGKSTEILSRTGTSLNMKPTVGKAQKMTGILMGAETIDQHGKSFILVVPDVSVYDPGMSDSLISAGRLMEAG